MNKVEVLITGATGYIGHSLFWKLSQKENVRCLEGRLEDKEAMLKETKGIKKVYHLAALIPTKNHSVDDYYSVNVLGTENLLEACKKNGVKEFVLVSTIGAVNPTEKYGYSKKEQEDLAIRFCNKNGIRLSIIRLPVVFPYPTFLKGLYELIKRKKVYLVTDAVEDILKAKMRGGQNG